MTPSTAAAWTAEALVLVVDDDPHMRSTLARILTAEGLTVSQAEDGVGALASVGLIQPDLIIMDVVMPGMNGIEVCRLLKESAATRLTPVLLLTGYADSESRLEGLEVGADDFISKPPERLELLARVKSLVRMKRHTDRLVRAESVVLTLARSIEGKDRYTVGHCERLSAYGRRLGEMLGLDASMLEAISYGGFLHDIGKVAVPDAILLKPGPLTEEEWAVMRRHPGMGEHICEPLQTFQDVLPIIRHHHEKGDGSGYPDGLTGDQIPVGAKVLQTVDVYDALISHRPYKAASSSEEALGVMEDEVTRGWWDPACFDAFASLVRADPRAFAGSTDEAWVAPGISLRSPT